MPVHVDQAHVLRGRQCVLRAAVKSDQPNSPPHRALQASTGTARRGPPHRTHARRARCPAAKPKKAAASRSPRAADAGAHGSPARAHIL